MFLVVLLGSGLAPQLLVAIGLGVGWVEGGRPTGAGVVGSAVPDASAGHQQTYDPDSFVTVF